MRQSSFTKILLTISLSFLLTLGVESKAQTNNLIGKCNWLPPKTLTAEALQSIKIIEEANGLAEQDKDYLQVAEKGRLYFHTLPNENCKSDLFIIKGDVVQIIDSYPNGDFSFNNSFARVLFYSKSLKSDVAGWVKMSSLRRLTESEMRRQ